MSHTLPHRLSRLETTLALALFFSGAAALVNQAVWQRSLGIYLAGCEALSAMIVVLVFMLGLGLGSLYVGCRAARLRDPARMLAIVELSLVAINLAIALLLSQDVGESIYAVQRVAASLGLPLRLVYGLLAVVVLLPPCFLMGTTFPLASDACQRQLGESDSRRLALLVFTNTLGAVLGALASGFVLMPFLGQTRSLVVGAAANGLAALTVLALYRAAALAPAPLELPASQTGATETVAGRLARRPEFVVGLVLGFLSLAYEMYVLRVVTLAHEPRPYNFSVVLCFYLLFWSLGAALGRRWSRGTISLLIVCGLMVALAPAFYLLDRTVLRREFGPLTVIGSAAVYTLPCLGFGLAFAQVLARAARRWGHDVGWFYGLNTLGSCLGILLTTLVGFEMDQALVAWSIAGGYVLLAWYYRRALISAGEAVLAGRRPALAAAAVAVVSLAALGSVRLARNANDGDPWISYWGKDGVIEIDSAGNLSWDGLWHSELAQDGDHVDENNWRLAVIPYLCRGRRPLDNVLVIGLGTGITAATLAAGDDVRRVDVYEINHTLRGVLRDYPQGTLHVAENPKINIRWRDGRSGLALDEQKYDLITQQPLYLRQSGSGNLLSREYFELVRSRLSPGGVFCIYCNATVDRHFRDLVDTEMMAAVVRRTADEVFPHCRSFYGGYMIVASNEPFVYDAGSIAARLAGADDPLTRQIRRVGVEAMAAALDDPPLDWSAPLAVTDDHPVIEYFELRQVLQSWLGGK